MGSEERRKDPVGDMPSSEQEWGVSPEQAPGLCSPVQVVGRRSRCGAICALGLLGRRPDCLQQALAATVPGAHSSKGGSWRGAPSVSRL